MATGFWEHSNEPVRQVWLALLLSASVEGLCVLIHLGYLVTRQGEDCGGNTKGVKPVLQ